MNSISQDRWKLIQRLSLLAYVHRGEESKDLYKAIIAAKVLKGIYDDLSDDSKTTQAREEAILAIVQYVQSHPRASERELQQEVEKQIALFIEKIQ